MIRVLPMIRKIQRTPTGSNPRPTSLWTFFLVGLIASSVRILSAMLWPGAVYFSDSWDYVVKALTSTDFYKSMTTHADHRIWQDVYRTATSSGDVYLKLTVVDDVLIVSFKEL